MRRTHGFLFAVAACVALSATPTVGAPSGGAIRVYAIGSEELGRLGFGIGWESVTQALLVASVGAEPGGFLPGDVVLSHGNTEIRSWADLDQELR